MALNITSMEIVGSPLADVIAVAIVKASRIQMVNPEDVLCKFGPELGLARAYAAVALHECFPEVYDRTIGVWVGAKHASTYLAVTKRDVRLGKTAWDDDEYERVRSAVHDVAFQGLAPREAI